MMIYLAYISIIFLFMQFMNVLLNVIFQQRLNSSLLGESDLISILIPARNEENNIGYLLDDLTKAENCNIEVLVYDDQSTDCTAQIVNEYTIVDPRIRYIPSVDLPLGWLGKNHACNHLAHEAKGSYFLFLDADVRLSGTIITDAVAYAKKYRLNLLSVFPTQILVSTGEKLSVPVMNYILLTLLPLIFVRYSPFKSHSAANGQFMLFHAGTYHKIKPHDVFRNSPVEDIFIARYYKKLKYTVACLTGDERIRCRMYSSYQQALLGFSKNVLMFFGNHPVLAFVYWIFATWGFIPVWLATPGYLIYYISGILAVLILYSAASKQNIVFNLLFFPLHLVFIFRILVNALIIKKSKNYSWKGRYIYT